MCLEDAALFNSRGLSHGGINILCSVKEMLLLVIRLNYFYSDKLADTHEYPLLLRQLQTSFSLNRGHVVAQLVEALHYKPEGRGFDSRWCHWNFSLT